tara:strand:+ start:1629 stop:1742 length:114 start_codon:yes stop_codon:yes gene_type:complete
MNKTGLMSSPKHGASPKHGGSPKGVFRIQQVESDEED